MFGGGGGWGSLPASVLPSGTGGLLGPLGKQVAHVEGHKLLAFSHRCRVLSPNPKKMGQVVRQPAPSIPTTVTQPELPGVGVGPGRKFSRNTELILSQRWQPGLWLEQLLLCGFEIPESLRAGDPGMVTPGSLLEAAVGLEAPSVCPEG